MSAEMKTTTHPLELKGLLDLLHLASSDKQQLPAFLAELTRSGPSLTEGEVKQLKIEAQKTLGDLGDLSDNCSIRLSP